MPGRHGAAKRAQSALSVADGRVEVLAQSGTIALVDARLPSEVHRDNQAALEQFKRKSAPFYCAIRAGAEEYGQMLRAELNALAGGEAPPSVMALAQAAIDAHANCQLAQHIVGHATGDLPGLPEKKQPARRLEITQLQRTAMGLDVAFTDLVRRATEAAKEAGKARQGSPTRSLLTRIGVAQPDGEVPTPFPSRPPGVGEFGAPTVLNPNLAPESPTPEPTE